VNEIETGVRERLNEVLVPGAMRSLVQMNLVRSIEVEDGRAKIVLALTAISTEHHSWLKDKIASVAREVSGVTDFPP
jgi:metal-sulfur cluster biosynthetic enzyme